MENIKKVCSTKNYKSNNKTKSNSQFFTFCCFCCPVNRRKVLENTNFIDYHFINRLIQSE